MPNVITTIRPTTELEAVNAMLAAIGEAPLASGTDLSTSTQADIETALHILKDATRKALKMGWKFNTEYGVQVSPTATHDWEDNDGVTTTLNIFKKPVDVLAWTQTQCPEMVGLDLVERLSKDYTEAAAAVMVLYDRAKNRDGAEAGSYPYIYINPIYAFDFVNIPESAREYITVRAARKFSQEVLGSRDLRRFTQEDEMAALRDLKRDQGQPTYLNMLQTAGAQNMLGNRPTPYGGYGMRVYPGKAP